MTKNDRDLHRFSMLAMIWECLSQSPLEKKSRRFMFAKCARELRAVIEAPEASVDDDGLAAAIDEKRQEIMAAGHAHWPLRSVERARLTLSCGCGVVSYGTHGESDYGDEVEIYCAIHQPAVPIIAAQNRLIEAAQAYLAARLAEAEAERDQRWRPIETAPKDGTVVILGRVIEPWSVVGFGSWLEVRGIGGWIPRAFNDPPGVLGLGDPSHWMPLPKGPE